MKAIRLWRAAVLCALLCVCGNRVAAQSASPWLPVDHWASRAAAQLHALGLTPVGFDPAAREHTRGEVAALLAHAWLTATAHVAASANRDDVAGADPAAILRLVDGYVRRFAEDHPAMFARAFVGARRSSYVLAELAAGLASREGALLAGGFDLNRAWLEPRPEPDYTTLGGTAEIGAVLRNRFALTLRGAREGGAGRIERLTVDAHFGGFAVWAGRRAAAYSPLLSGGLVQHGNVAFEGGGVRITDPLLGAFTAETFVGKLEPNGHVADPWLWGTRVHATPHARFDAGVTRTAVFGAMRDAQLGLKQIAEIIIGANLAGDYADDQVASIDARWRPPLGGVPLELYGEWGIHDIDLEVFIDVPAFGMGASVPALPFAPNVGIAVEHTRISRSSGANPPWYHHFELADGWTEDGVLLGHPFGGHGREWRMAASATLFETRALVDVQAFRRTRGVENLFADARIGRSHGGSMQLRVRANPRVSLKVQGTYESASSWNSHSLGAFVRLRL